MAPAPPTTIAAYPTSASAYEVGAAVGRRVHEAAVLEDGDGGAPPTRRVVALKRVDLDAHASLRRVRDEVSLAGRLHHRNVARLHAAFVAGGELWLVLPFHDGGSCRDLMRATHPSGLPEDACLAVAREVASGLSYLHEQGVLHRNLKASNVLVDSGGGVRLADFAVARDLCDGGRSRLLVVGLQRVCDAPDSLRKKNVKHAARGEHQLQDAHDR